MNVKEIKTRKILPPKDDLIQLLNFIPKLNDKSIVAISSKVVSICEGRTMPADTISHEALVNKLADKVLEPFKRGPNGMILTQAGNLLVESAGVDRSNANGFYVLLPKDPYKSAYAIWKYLRRKNKIKHLGVVITDSHSVPRRLGAEGFALASYGFKAAHVYKDKKDVFGKKFHFTASDVADSIAASAVLVMGEGDECTPLAVITGLNDVEYFKGQVSIRATKRYGWVHPNLDVYSPLLDSSVWQDTKMGRPLHR